MSTLAPSWPTPQRGTKEPTSRETCSRFALSAVLSSACGVYPTLPRRVALVMSFSATRRSSLALASGVSMRSCVIRLAARFRSIALRLDVSRSNFLPEFLCRMVILCLAALRLRLLRLPALEELRPVVDLHPERETHVGEDLLDLLEGLATEVLGLEHVLLAALHQLADERDVRVLQAVRRADGELELLDGAEEVLVERAL